MKVKNPQTFAVKLTAPILLALVLLVMVDFVDDSFLDHALPHTPITFAGTTAYIANLTTSALSSAGYVGLSVSYSLRGPPSRFPARLFSRSPDTWFPLGDLIIG